MPWREEETRPATDGAEDVPFQSLPSLGWLAAVALLADRISLLRDFLRCGQITKSGFAPARLIRHILIFQPVAVVPLAIPVVITAFRRALMLAVGFPVLFSARQFPAAIAAVALAAETWATDTEDRPTPQARSL